MGLLSDRDFHPQSRPWKVIADELTHATDPKEILALTTELNQALREQRENHPARPVTDDSSEEKAG